MFLSRLCARRSFSISHATLSGHNKWSKIKQKKGANDAQRSVAFAKASRDIVVAARAGGSADPDKNMPLFVVLKRARAQGVPKDNIEKALAKASGKDSKGGGDQTLTYEAARNAVGLIIECTSDNVNRTGRAVRDILHLHGARLAPVGFMFERKGYVRVGLGKGDYHPIMERIIEVALEATAEDFEEVEPADSTIDDAELEFTCPPNTLATLTTAVSAPGLCRELLASERIYVPLENNEGEDEVVANVATLIDALEENEDVLRVWTTIDS